MSRTSLNFQIIKANNADGIESFAIEVSQQLGKGWKLVSVVHGSTPERSEEVTAYLIAGKSLRKYRGGTRNE